MIRGTGSVRRATRVWGEAGQALVLAALLLPVLLAMAALVFDLGNLYVQKASVQQAADASVLAVVQDLPLTQSTAQTTAQEWVSENDGGTADTTVVATSPDNFSTRVQVIVTKNVSLIFPVFGTHRTVSATATARNASLGTAYWVLPLAVTDKQTCGREPGDPPCIAPGEPETLGYDYVRFHKGSCAKGDEAFCFTYFGQTAAVTEAAEIDATIADWIRGGYPSPLTVPFSSAFYNAKDYKAGNTSPNQCGHNASPASCVLIQAIKERAGDLVLLPVFHSPNINPYQMISFAAMQLATPTAANPDLPYLRNPWEANNAHWLVVGHYLGSVTCKAPPTNGGTPPADVGQACYGTAATVVGTPDFGVGVLSLVE